MTSASGAHFMFGGGEYDEDPLARAPAVPERPSVAIGTRAPEDRPPAGTGAHFMFNCGDFAVENFPDEPDHAPS